MNGTERWYGCYDGTRKDLFTAESNRHPAKMSVGLCFRIFEHGEKMGYWKKGDLILDPMAGIGTTLIVGGVLGYRTVGVELELHFVDLCQQNIDNVIWQKYSATCVPRIMQGDARCLTEILKVNGAMTSPPYPSIFREDHPGTKGGQVGLDLERRGSFRGYSGAVSSPVYGESEVTGQGHFRSEREPSQKDASDNPHERYAGIVSSPPYADQSVVAGAGMTARILQECREHGMDAAIKLYRETVIDTQKAHGRWSDENIRKHIELALATRKSGYSAVVSSPPQFTASTRASSSDCSSASIRTCAWTTKMCSGSGNEHTALSLC